MLVFFLREEEEGKYDLFVVVVFCFHFKEVYRFVLFSVLLVADWKVTNIECVLERLLETCPNLEAVSVSGWKEFTGDHLAFLVQKFKSLQRIDLSSVNVSFSMNINVKEIN